MKIVVFGGTGAVGQIIVEKLLEQEQEVTVLTRQQKTSHGNVTYVTGNVLDPDCVSFCLEEGDKVIICLGFNESEDDTMSRGTKNILEAMQLKNCRRLACLSAQGVAESWDYMPGEFKEMVLNDPILNKSFHDHGIQEAYIRDSELDWMIVRPTEIVDEPETKAFQVNRPAQHAAFRISKYDVAQYLIDELLNEGDSNKVVMITN